MNKTEYVRTVRLIAHTMQPVKGKQVRILHDLVTVFAERYAVFRGIRKGH